jgi:hypothetical protein
MNKQPHIAVRFASEDDSLAGVASRLERMEDSMMALVTVLVHAAGAEDGPCQSDHPFEHHILEAFVEQIVQERQAIAAARAMVRSQSQN